MFQSMSFLKKFFHRRSSSLKQKDDGKQSDDKNTQNSSNVTADSDEVKESDKVTQIDFQAVLLKNQVTRQLFEEKLSFHHVQNKQNWFTRSKYFNNLCEEIFRQVDTDNSRSVDKKETYIAVLMLYLRLAPFIKGLIPPSEELVAQLVKQNDTKDLKELNCEEFKAFVTVLLSNISTRIGIQIFFAFIIIPVISNKLLDLVCVRFSSICKKTGSYLPDGIAFTMVSSVITVLSIPYVLTFIDRLFLSKLKPEKAIKIH